MGAAETSSARPPSRIVASRDSRLTPTRRRGEKKRVSRRYSLLALSLATTLIQISIGPGCTGGASPSRADDLSAQWARELRSPSSGLVARTRLLTQSLSAHEFDYLSRMNWSRLNSSNALTDPTLRRAVNILRRYNRAHPSAARGGSLSLGVAYATDCSSSVQERLHAITAAYGHAAGTAVVAVTCAALFPGAAGVCIGWGANQIAETLDTPSGCDAPPPPEDDPPPSKNPGDYADPMAAEESCPGCDSNNECASGPRCPSELAAMVTECGMPVPNQCAGGPSCGRGTLCPLGERCDVSGACVPEESPCSPACAAGETCTHGVCTGLDAGMEDGSAPDGDMRGDVPDAPRDAARDAPPDVNLVCPENMLPVQGTSRLGYSHAFCMDRTEVTVAEYRRCPTCGPPDPYAAPGVFPNPNCNWGRPGADNHPVNCVGVRFAQAYCEWRGARLPTPGEFMFAGEGPDGRTYPWGEDAPAWQLCWMRGGDTRDGTCPVGSYPNGRSQFGLEDLAGNVGEWAVGAFFPGETPDTVLALGGSWTSSYPEYVRPSAGMSKGSPPLDEFGFRCVSDGVRP